VTVRSRCGCCGVPTQFERLGKCPVCSMCMGVHGDRLQEGIVAAWAAGKLEPYQALAMMLVDDALIAGTLTLVREPGIIDSPIATLGIRVVTPRRWQVYIARQLATDVMPALDAVVHHALLPFWGRDNVARVRAEVETELASALRTFDTSLLGATVSCKRATLAPGEVVIEIQQRIDPAIDQLSLEVEIPDGRFTKKPANA
jgi:hypothetical protein